MNAMQEKKLAQSASRINNLEQQQQRDCDGGLLGGAAVMPAAQLRRQSADLLRDVEDELNHINRQIDNKSARAVHLRELHALLAENPAIARILDLRDTLARDDY